LNSVDVSESHGPEASGSPSLLRSGRAGADNECKVRACSLSHRAPGCCPLAPMRSIKTCLIKEVGLIQDVRQADARAGQGMRTGETGTRIVAERAADVAL
jgi:hypothetical protein